MRKYFDTALLANGLPAGGAKVTVLIQSSQMNAVIYSDQGITPIPNPVTCDSTGFFSFFAADGTYQLNFSDANGVLLKTVTQVEIVELQPLATGSGGTGVTTTRDSIFYRNTSTQAIPNATPTTITNWTLVDTIGANFNATTGVYTVPVTGRYTINAGVTTSAAANVAGAQIGALIVVNGSSAAQGLSNMYGTQTITVSAQVGATMLLTAGQTVVIQTTQTTLVTRNLSNVAVGTYVSIVQVI